MKVYLANPRGFCAGVDRAIEIVERAIELFGSPMYVRHEIVHNKHVCDELRAKGAVFVEELHEVPDEEYVIFSAHGVSRAIVEDAEKRGLKTINATCPLVTKVHMEAKAMAKRGFRLTGARDERRLPPILIDNQAGNLIMCQIQFNRQAEIITFWFCF